MSGHNKFSNIKHKKEKNDAAKGKIFTRIGREIAVAVERNQGQVAVRRFRIHGTKEMFEADIQADEFDGKLIELIKDRHCK